MFSVQYTRPSFFRLNISSICRAAAVHFLFDSLLRVWYPVFSDLLNRYRSSFAFPKSWINQVLWHYEEREENNLAKFGG